MPFFIRMQDPPCSFVVRVKQDASWYGSMKMKSSSFSFSQCSVSAITSGGDID